MGTNCCKSEDKTTQTSKETHQVIESKFNTYTVDSYDDVFKTKPPCWFGHDNCPCPCHRGGQCIFK
jgi:hypothetical protein